MSNILKALSPKHSQMAFYLAHGVKQEDVAKHFDMHPASLQRLRNDSLFNGEVSRYRALIEERSLMVVDDALESLRGALGDFTKEIVRIAKDSTSDSIKLRAIDLGFALIKPSIDKDAKSIVSMPALNINVRSVDAKPTFRVTEGGGV